mgnify:CR=1 FL=1
MACTIGLVYDLRSDYLKEGCTLEQVAELDTEATIDALDATLRSLGYATDRIGHARALCERLVRGATPVLVEVEADDREAVARDVERERRLAQTGRTVEEHVLQGFASLFGCRDGDLELLSNALLPDAFAERLRTQRYVEALLGLAQRLPADDSTYCHVARLPVLRRTARTQASLKFQV